MAASVAMLLYPGGTAHDHATSGYRIRGNFLSDLGMSVAYDGRPNRLGAALFVASVALLVVAMGGALLGFVRLYSATDSGRRFAVLAAATGAVASFCFAGVALTPEDRAMPLHVAFTLAAFRTLSIVALLLTLAAAATPGVRRGAVHGWTALTTVLLGYAAMLQGGAWTATAEGFAALVIAQKVVTIVLITVVIWECRLATGSAVDREESRP